MGAKPEDTQREIGQLREDASDAVAELFKRLGVGGGGAAAGDGSANGPTRELLRESTLGSPATLAVAGSVAVCVVGFALYRAFDARREARKPQRQVASRVEEVRSGLEGWVDDARHRLSERRPDTLLKVNPEKGGYLRVTDVRLEPHAEKGRASNVLKKLFWGALLSVFMAVSSVAARRLAGTLWKASVGEDPPTEKPQK